MWSFFFGLVAGATALLNGPVIRRKVAKAALKGGDAAVAVGREARRISAQVVEDFEDAFAEAREERSREEMSKETLDALHQQVHALREEIASLTGKPPRQDIH